MEKQALRKKYLAERKALSEEELDKRNSLLLEHFVAFSSERSHLKIYHCFLPIARNKEVDTWQIIDHLKAMKKQVVVSKSDLDTNLMTNYLLEDDNQLVINRWGIPEPAGGSVVSEQDIDAVLIPLLIFDRSGHRVGYGKGYYDRFLDSCRNDVVKIGMSLLPPIEQIHNQEAHDIPMDYCLTYEGLYDFKRSM